MAEKMRALVGVGGRRRSVVLLLVGLAMLASVPLLSGSLRSEPMVATWYGPGFEGTTTASGEPFDATDYTAASRTLDFGTKLIVTYDGRSVVVRINDRGPYSDADLDLSQAAAEYLGYTDEGQVTVDAVQTDPSTPTGPYSAPSEGTEAAEDQYEPAAQDAAEDAAGDQYAGDQYDAEEEPVRPQANAAAEAEAQIDAAAVIEEVGADDEQYAAADALASVGEDQYEDGVAGESAEETAAPAAPIVEAAPVAQEISTPPPAELATPGSTVERRLQLAEQPVTEVEEPTAEKSVAEEPVEEEPVEEEPAEEQPAEEQPAIVSGSAELPSESLAVLPDTGGDAARPEAAPVSPAQQALVPFAVAAAGLVLVGLSGVGLLRSR